MEDEELLFENYTFEEPKGKVDSFSLLIYDIVDNKKRTKFAKYMESYGTRVQKSAFEIRVNKRLFKQMVSGIPQYVSNEDSVKLYKIYGDGEVMCWGNAKPEISEEVLIF